MKKMQISLLALLGIIFAVSSAFTFRPVKKDGNETIFQFYKKASGTWTSEPTPGDAVSEGTPIGDPLVEAPEPEELDDYRLENCSGSGNICFVVVEVVDGNPVAVNSRQGDHN